MAARDLSEFFAAQAALVPARRASFGRAERLAALEALRGAVEGARGEITAALESDFGKHPVETLLSEILPVLSEIAHARRHLRRWMRPRRVAPSLAMLGSRARIVPQPKGVALVIAPWNYPFSLALGPLVSALAAGCSVIVKPSEQTPVTSALIARLIGATFPPDLVAVAEGGADVSTGLLSLPFDHIFFTGSPAVGRIVMAAAAKHLTPVTLELGGKSPVILGTDSDLAGAARWIAWGRFFNAGQTCVAPDHVYVPAGIAEAFADRLKEEVARMWSAPDALAKIVSDRHWRRVKGLIDDARAMGATVVTGGQGDAASRSLAPTILTGTTGDMEVTREEIFGPVLPLIPYDDLGAVIAGINAGPRPLALYVFGGQALADRVMRETSSGSVGVNLTLLTFAHANLPFGGIGNSGLGAGHGEAGFRAFSHDKPVLTNRFLAMPMLFPPYGARVKRLAALVTRLSG
ncbi:MAG: aldehyde dehydrogenase family protein [Rhodobacteraceae bacterium]|nr:aldehyde dehydrogenase family protein [Paracoccaceae bacterium]